MDLRERKTARGATDTRYGDDDEHNSPSKADRRKSKVSKRSQSLVKWLFIFAIILFKFVIVAKLSPYMRYKRITSSYIKLEDLQEFSGNLAPNTLLQDVELFGKGRIHGPETVAFLNDTMYTGLTNGQLVRVDDSGNTHLIVQIGDANPSKCSQVKHKAVPECGRPLGIRIVQPNWIYVADAYYGILKVDVLTKQKTTLVAVDDKRLKNSQMKFPDDVDVDTDDGNVYFTDASPYYGLEESGEVFFEASPNGMVYRYNERTDELELLMDDLRFSNGIQLTPEKDAILVSDLCAARIVKFYIKGDKKGQREVFANLPGFPDNIRSTDRNTLLVALAITRFPNPYYSSLLDSLGEHPRLRTFIGSILNIEKVAMESQKYGLVLEYDFNGNLLRSWHDPTGLRIGSTSCVTLHKNKLYLGTFFLDFIGILNY